MSYLIDIKVDGEVTCQVPVRFISVREIYEYLVLVIDNSKFLFNQVLKGEVTYSILNDDTNEERQIEEQIIESILSRVTELNDHGMLFGDYLRGKGDDCLYFYLEEDTDEIRTFISDLEIIHRPHPTKQRMQIGSREFGREAIHAKCSNDQAAILKMTFGDIISETTTMNDFKKKYLLD